MIEQLGLVNFCGHTKSLSFGSGLNMLLGPNESGKSTVKEALAFLWYGTDSAGGKNPDDLITFGEPFTEVSVRTEHATIVRRKRRGSTSTIKLTRHGFAPVSPSQTELSQVLGLSLNAFMSCWNVGYFMHLKQVEQLAVLGELSKVDRAELLRAQLPEGVSIPSKVRLVDIKVDINNVATERRQLQNILASDQGALGQVESHLAQLGAAQGVDVESFQRRLDEVNALLTDFDFYHKAVAKYQSARSRFENDSVRRNDLKVELKQVEESLGNTEAQDFKDTVSLKQRVENLIKKGEELKTQRQSNPTPPAKPKNLTAGSQCGTCGQEVKEGHVKKIMADYESALLEYNKVAREVATHNDKVMAEERKVGEEILKLQNEIAQTEAQKKAHAAHVEQLRKKHNYLNAELEKPILTEPVAPARPQGDEESLRKEQLELSTEINTAHRQATQVDGLVKKKALLEEAVAGRTMQIEGLRLVEEGLKRLPQIEVERLLSSLAVEGVSVELVEGDLVVRSGSISYQRLSTGRKKKVDIEFAKSLRQAAGAKAPTWLFVDDADLVDRWAPFLPKDTQVMVAKVDPELQEMMVVNHG